MTTFRCDVTASIVAISLLVGCSVNSEKGERHKSSDITLEVNGRAISIQHILEVWHSNPNRAKVLFQDVRVVARPLQVPELKPIHSFSGFEIPLSFNPFPYPQQLQNELFQSSDLSVEIKYGTEESRRIREALQRIRTLKINQNETADLDEFFEVTAVILDFDLNRASGLDTARPIDLHCGSVVITPVRLQFDGCSQQDLSNGSLGEKN